MLSEALLFTERMTYSLRLALSDEGGCFVVNFRKICFQNTLHKRKIPNFVIRNNPKHYEKKNPYFDAAFRGSHICRKS